MNDFIQDLHINPEELDVEWLRQPQLYAKYAQQVSALKAAADRAKERVEVVKAELDREIRTGPEKFGLVKVTETAVASAVAEHARYQEAVALKIDAAEQASQGFNALGALDHRKAALENLVKLHLAQWFSGPSSPHQLGSDWSEKLEARRQGQVREKLTERKTRRTR